MKALDGSIEKWSKTGDEFVDRGADNCPLCILYVDNDCRNCPIFKYMNMDGCKYTPFVDFRNHYMRNHLDIGKVRFAYNLECPECDKLRKKEFAFLKKVKRNCVVKGGK
jgi:hypothetical protein